jgi:hypothetical protein
LVIGLCVLALGLAYLVVTETVASALRGWRPDVAVMWSPIDGDSRLADANERVGEALTDSEIRQAVDRSTGALRAAPASAIGLRILGQAYLLSGERDKAESLMLLAGKRNVRDADVQLWLFRDGLQARRYGDAYTRADLLMRRHGEMNQTIYPTLVAGFQDPAARAALLALMRRGPSWREDFFNAAAADPSGITQWLLANLAASPHPPTEREVGLVVQALAAQGKWSQVRSLWGQFGPRDGALLTDGDFEKPPREPPFGWTFLDSDGAVAAIERLENGRGRGLFTQFPSGRKSGLAEALVVLPPGRYRMSGRGKVDQLPSGALFQWSVACSDNSQVLFQFAFTSTGDWRKFEGEFETPAAGCEAQSVRLLGNGGQGYITASAWFDDIKLERVS